MNNFLPGQYLRWPLFKTAFLWYLCKECIVVKMNSFLRYVCINSGPRDLQLFKFYMLHNVYTFYSCATVQIFTKMRQNQPRNKICVDPKCPGWIKDVTWHKIHLNCHLEIAFHQRLLTWILHLFLPWSHTFSQLVYFSNQQIILLYTAN